MTQQPEDFWSFSEWLLRPGAFLESALLQGVAVAVMAIILGLLLGYIVSAVRYGPGEAFYAVASTIRDLVTRDLPKTAPQRIFALARLAFKEAIRRKVLFVFGVFMVGLLLAGWFLDTNSNDPARLYISFVLTATNYLMLLLALFISCFSLPADIKSRTIYTIVTKPVRPTEIIIGRILGFTAIGTMLLVPMGVASYFFVTRGLDHGHEVVEIEQLANTEKSAELLRRVIRERPTGSNLEAELAQRSEDSYIGITSFDRDHSHTFTIDEEGNGITSLEQGHRHVVYKEGDKFIVGPPEGALRARVPEYGSITFLNREGLEDVGIDVGYEHRKGGYGSAGFSRFAGASIGARRIEHGYIEGGGGSLCAAIVKFDNITAERYGDGLPLEMRLRVFRTYKADIVSAVRGTITVRNPDNQEIESKPIEFDAEEYLVKEYFLPVELEGNEGSSAATLNLFEDLVGEDGSVEVVVRCLDRGQYLGLTKGDVYLRPQESTFLWNLTKAFISIWLQMVMIIAFGVMFSTMLSGPVAMIATAVVVLLGFSAESVYETRYHLDRGENMGGGPIEATIRTIRQDSFTTQLDIQELPLKIIKGADSVIVYTLDAVVTSLPNLPKMLGTAEYVASGFDIYDSLLLRHIASTIAYVILAFLIGYFFLKTREIAA